MSEGRRELRGRRRQQRGSATSLEHLIGNVSAAYGKLLKRYKLNSR